MINEECNKSNNPFKFLLVVISILLLQLSGMVYGQETKPVLPKGKQTVPGLYVTSEEAYYRWKAAPESIKILDVRTIEEYIFVGHAEMAWNIPLAFQTEQWDDSKKHFAIEPNPDFVKQVKKWFSPDETIMVMCRSGHRSAMAVNILTEAGFSTVYNITDGMEGDMVKDSKNLYYMKRMKNGWKNSGIPWTYDINPEQVIVDGKE
jgi:rhodanese-related sulfurtransferase